MHDEILASVGVNGQAIELWLNPDNTYNILITNGQVTSILHSGVYAGNIQAEIAVIQDNEPRLQQGYRLIIEQE